MDGVTAQMKQGHRKEALEHPSLACSRHPSPLLPPEIIADIFSHLRHSSIDEEKATFSRLCLVNRSFLPSAQQHLYSSLKLHIHADSTSLGGMLPRYETRHRKTSLLLSTLVSTEPLAHLLRDLDVSFLNPPPLPDDLVHAISAIEALPNLKKLRFEGERKNWRKAWEGKGKKKDLSDLRLVISQAQHLQVLAIPQVSFDPINTYHLLDSLKQLKRFKGELHAPTNDSTPPLDLKLTHLDVSHHESPRDLAFYITPCSLTLRYLHLHFDGITPLISLSALTNLERLITTVEPDFRASGRSSSEAFLSTLESIRSLPKLSSLTLQFKNTNLLDAIRLCRDLLRQGLPRNIEEFAIGPDSHPFLMNARSLLGTARTTYPRLREMAFVQVEGPDNDASRNEFTLGVRDVKGVYGIEVNWMEEKEWEEWLESKFYRG